MTDPNLHPATPPPGPAYPQGESVQPQAPQYAQPYGQPVYGQEPYGQPAYGQQVPQNKYNALAIVSLVSAFFIPLVAVITGHIALSQIKRTGELGHGLAIAGLVLGYIAIALFIVAIILLLAFLPYIASMYPDTFNPNNFNPDNFSN